MSEKLVEFLFRAYRDGVECSLSDLRSYEEFSTLGLMQSINAINARLTQEGLCIQPDIDEGEMDEPRVVGRMESEEIFNAALERALISAESHDVEFKESLYLKKKVFGNQAVAKEHWVSEDIVFEVMATICSFLNGDGGTLLIGVSDDGELEGIDCELEHIPGAKNTLDNWELFFSNCLKKYIYEFSSCIGYVKRKIINVKDAHVCVVIVKKRMSALSVCKNPNDPKSEIVFVRNGNGKAQIQARAIEELVKSRTQT